MTRRLSPILVCCVFFVLACSSRADAWWDFIERLSGPGRFMGPHIETRLFCFVDTSLMQARQKTAAAYQLEREIREQQRETRKEISETDLERAVLAWRAAGLSSITAAGPSLDRTLVQEEARKARPTSDAKKTLQGAVPKAVDLKSLERYRESAEMMLALAEEHARTDPQEPVRFAAVGGIIYTACAPKDGARRRGSVNLTMRFTWARGDPQFAGGETIWLTTIEPSVSWRVFKGKKKDWLDYGIGAGVYWITSEAFPSVSGAFLEPARFDIRPSPALVEKAAWTQLFLFRVGLLVFPGGFEPDAFAPTPDAARRISTDLVPTYGFFVDLEPFLNYLNRQKSAARR